MGQFGICDAVLITETGEIINGHSLVEACKRQGITDVPCLIVGHLTNSEIRRLRISVNRIQEKGEWDFQELRAEVNELSLEWGPDFQIPGVEFAELDALLLNSDPDSELDTAPSRKADEDITSELEDVWNVEQHRVGCGDARDLAFMNRLLSGRKVRVNFSDPPYNVHIQNHVTRGDHREFPMASGEMSDDEFLTFVIQTLVPMRNSLVDGAIVMAFMDWRGLQFLLEAGRQVGFGLLNIVVWFKSNAGMGSLYRSQHEFVVVFKHGTAPSINNIELGKHGRWRSNVWQYPGASSLGSDARDGLEDHPTPKPVRLLEDAILDVTNRSDLVYDSFAGSGSTLIAAERTSRVFAGTELDPGYVDVIIRRWAKLTGGTVFLDATGETFEEVRARRHADRKTQALPMLTQHEVCRIQDHREP